MARFGKMNVYISPTHEGILHRIIDAFHNQHVQVIRGDELEKKKLVTVGDGEKPAETEVVPAAVAS
jgi:hypothetical protein